MTASEKKEASRVYNLEQQQRYNERQIRKYKRLSDASVDPENRDRYYKSSPNGKRHRESSSKQTVMYQNTDMRTRQFMIEVLLIMPILARLLKI
jgi:hypothetical protein